MASWIAEIQTKKALPMEKVTKAPVEAGETLAAVVIPAVPVAEAMVEALTGMMVLPAVQEQPMVLMMAMVPVMAIRTAVITMATPVVVMAAMEVRTLVMVLVRVRAMVVKNRTQMIRPSTNRK